MSTENEQLLTDKVNELGKQIEMMSIYMESLVQHIEMSSISSGDYSYSFNNMQTVELYLPFYFQFDSTMSVVIEEQPGYFRSISPSFTYSGPQVTLMFDRPYSGNVVVTCGTPTQQTLPRPPMPITNELVLVSDTVVVSHIPPMKFNNQEIAPPTDLQYMTPKTPVGSENISENNFTKAMKGISTWP